MIWSVYFPFPGGKSLGFSGFIALWFRELLIVGAFGFALVAPMIVRFYKLLTKRRKSKALATE
jgi:hypothetical protein